MYVSVNWEDVRVHIKYVCFVVGVCFLGALFCLSCCPYFWSRLCVLLFVLFVCEHSPSYGSSNMGMLLLLYQPAGAEC